MVEALIAAFDCEWLGDGGGNAAVYCEFPCKDGVVESATQPEIKGVERDIKESNIAAKIFILMAISLSKSK